MLWSLLAVYSNQNYGLSEQLFGWIPTTNALMCVFIQLPVTQITKRFSPLPVIAIGMMVYAIGVGSVALMAGFWGFWLSMVIHDVRRIDPGPYCIQVRCGSFPRGLAWTLYELLLADTGIRPGNCSTCMGAGSTITSRREPFGSVALAWVYQVQLDYSPCPKKCRSSLKRLFHTTANGNGYPGL